MYKIKPHTGNEQKGESLTPDFPFVQIKRANDLRSTSQSAEGMVLTSPQLLLVNALTRRYKIGGNQALLLTWDPRLPTFSCLHPTFFESCSLSTCYTFVSIVSSKSTFWSSKYKLTSSN
jgi:hypothetical protein